MSVATGSVELGFTRLVDPVQRSMELARSRPPPLFCGPKCTAAPVVSCQPFRQAGGADSLAALPSEIRRPRRPPASRSRQAGDSRWFPQGGSGRRRDARRPAHPLHEAGARQRVTWSLARCGLRSSGAQGQGGVRGALGDLKVAAAHVLLHGRPGGRLGSTRGLALSSWSVFPRRTRSRGTATWRPPSVT